MLLHDLLMVEARANAGVPDGATTDLPEASDVAEARANAEVPDGAATDLLEALDAFDLASARASVKG